MKSLFDSSWAKTGLLVFAAIAAFHAAFEIPALSFLMIASMGALYGLGRDGSGRHAFYSGLAAGFGMFAPQLGFFWNIFGAAAISLWVVLAFWIALFVWMSRQARACFGPMMAAALAPVMWTGLEYFRSELYFLRFSWLNAGSVFAQSPHIDTLLFFGVYGAGYFMMAAASAISLAPRYWRLAAWVALFAGLGWYVNRPVSMEPSRLAAAPQAAPPVALPMAGVELEFPAQIEVLYELERLAKRHPNTRLLVLSEYTFDGPVPERVRDWCRKRDRYLIAGGKEALEGNAFYNTVFVVDPRGKVVFKQAKSAPIQFFKDGVAAAAQKVWASPWGKMGLCICYDLSYSRVVDPLIQMGAQALIVPAMDVEEWGRREKRLHTRIALIRAAEHGIPIFRLASSGISQLVDRYGRTVQSTERAGSQAVLAGQLRVGRQGSVPPDRHSAPWMSAFAGALIPLFFWMRPRRKIDNQAESQPSRSGGGMAPLNLLLQPSSNPIRF
jgi:apolipoprotein N-acyltransferase